MEIFEKIVNGFQLLTAVNYFREKAPYQMFDWALNASMNIWDKLFKSRASKICGRQPLKNLKR